MERVEREEDLWSEEGMFSSFILPLDYAHNYLNYIWSLDTMSLEFPYFFRNLAPVWEILT